MQHLIRVPSITKVVNITLTKPTKLDKPRKSLLKGNRKVRRGAQTLKASTWINLKSLLCLGDSRKPSTIRGRKASEEQVTGR